MTPHLIIDFETFSKNQHECVVADCAAFVFDFDRLSSKPYSFQEILKNSVRYKLDTKSQKNLGYKTEKDTLDFWAKQNKTVRDRLAPHSDDLSVNEFADKFAKMVRGHNIKKCWARGIDFDTIILRRLLRDGGQTELYDSHLQFWKWIDTRSFIDGATMLRLRNDFIPIEDEDSWNKHFQKHNSSHDIAADILRIQKLAEIHSE